MVETMMTPKSRMMKGLRFNRPSQLKNFSRSACASK